jgi:NDP-4-keto-2,6-dideoxyhexose 3-C-methyltransferase
MASSDVASPPPITGASEPIVHTTCRGCRAPALAPLFSLGDLCLCNDFIAPTDEPVRIPLELVLCSPEHGGCGLVQLRHTTPQHLMYTQYWYKSGLSSTMRDHLAALVEKAERAASLQPDHVVLDIGANDGTTLRAYQTRGIRRIGFEPNQLHREARVGTTAIVNDFFNAQAFHEVAGGDKAQVVTTIAMFYDLDDPNRFIHDVRECLAPNGVWMIEMHYLPSMLTSNGFDAIVHEHVTYYSLRSLQRLLAAHHLEVFDVELNAMNGGSFRVYVRHEGATFATAEGAAARVRAREDEEDRLQLERPETYRRFWRRIGRARQQLRTFLQDEVAKGRTVYVYGASTKGNALLQFFDLDARVITAAGDKNADKWGRLTPGTRIPIVSPQEAANARPDYMLVLIWHLIDEVREQWQPYLAAGGRLIVPLPRFRVISA